MGYRWFKGSRGLLPAVGIGMLLKYLPTKDYFAYLLVGFVLAVYFQIPILGISLLGAAIALIVYKNRSNNTQNQLQQEVLTKMNKKLTKSTNK